MKRKIQKGIEEILDELPADWDISEEELLEILDDVQKHKKPKTQREKKIRRELSKLMKEKINKNRNLREE